MPVNQNTFIQYGEWGIKLKNRYWKFTIKFLLYSIISFLLAAFATVLLAYGFYKIFDDTAVRIQVHWFVSIIQGFSVLSLALIFILLAIAVTLMWIFTRHTTKRMHGISIAISQMREDNFRVLLPNDQSDSLGEIEQGINALAGQVQDTLTQRKEIEAVRKSC